MNTSKGHQTEISKSLKYENFRVLDGMNFDIEKLSLAANSLLKMAPLDPITSQVCLTHTEMKTSDELAYEGTGSLTVQWSKDPYDNNGELKKREIPLLDSDFSVFNEKFQNNYLYQVYKDIQQIYTIGRFRLICLPPKKCMSWHKDPEERLHIAIHSDTSCRMVIDDESFHIPQNGSTIWCDTTKLHTAFNGSHKLQRLHLVIGIHEK
jgi:hypothetical protein